MLNVPNCLRGKKNHLAAVALRHQIAQDTQILLCHHVLCRHHARSFQSYVSFVTCILLPCAMISNDFFSASAAINFAAASPSALTIIEARIPSAFNTCYHSLPPLALTLATLPRLVITSRIRSPSARRTSDLLLKMHSHIHLLERSLLICFSITFLMSFGGRMFWISTRVIVTPHLSASKWILVSLNSPTVCLFQQLFINCFSRREGIIQGDLGHNVTKRGLH